MAFRTANYFDDEICVRNPCHRSQPYNATECEVESLAYLESFFVFKRPTEHSQSFRFAPVNSYQVSVRGGIYSRLVCDGTNKKTTSPVRQSIHVNCRHELRSMNSKRFFITSKYLGSFRTPKVVRSSLAHGDRHDAGYQEK